MFRESLAYENRLHPGLACRRSRRLPVRRPSQGNKRRLADVQRHVHRRPFLAAGPDQPKQRLTVATALCISARRARTDASRSRHPQRRHVHHDRDVHVRNRRRNCRLKWKNTYKPVGPQQGRANRGVALLDGKLFRGTPDAHLLALDEHTGKTLWDVTVADSSNGSSTIAAPLAWNGKVYMGIAGSELGVKGKM